ncbi:MAG TPA: hypothetical protein VMW24_13210 [Sedimentisphaerales bacterium]|nr:hypothetical protein [Sedimentisphaerales bacterium]
MRWQQAWEIGMEVVEALSPVCDRIMVAGSVRQGKAEPKDIEIVLIPALIERRVDLFTTEQVRSLDEMGLLELVEDRLVLDPEVKRDGPRYKRLMHMRTGAVVEVFAARPETWGYILALRTGPADFMHKLVTARAYGGAMPPGRCVKSGWMWRYSEGRMHELPTPTEVAFFREVEVPCWQPEERSAIRLAEFLGEAAR